MEYSTGSGKDSHRAVPERFSGCRAEKYGTTIIKQNHLRSAWGEHRRPTPPLLNQRQIKSSRVKSSRVKSSQVKSSQAKSNQIKSSQVKSSQVKSSQVKSIIKAQQSNSKYNSVL
ncbi:hypothetical protein L873DRAFT_1840825 [Choiromyces venosus 120613-1]|uniref:Uncharacterized protein n=1 Tax=Choiromyces venosus 120613-1 TaxID=1336337 RepID=A0A3N4K096_9PEZI|nr:hypothetical protein L873DRAFT_1840825 [Choiromyces venosus 120613-1]